MLNLNIEEHSTESLLESINTQVCTVPYQDDLDSNFSEQTTSTEGVNMANERDCRETRKRCPVIFNKKILGNGNCLWTFFLNTWEGITAPIVNDFITKLLQVKPNDKVLIHAAPYLELILSETLVSFLKSIPCKDITISAPFCKGLGSVYFLTAAKTILVSHCSVLLIDSDVVVGCGKNLDAKAGLAIEELRLKRALGVLVNDGFMSANDMSHILDNQGMVCKYGTMLVSSINKYNNGEYLC